MNFKEVVDFLNHEDMTETVVSPEDPPQQERELTDKDEDVVLEALAAAKANSAFCKKGEEEGK